jgi:hypothetical protein
LQPHVDFGLKLLGADAMSIPGLYRIVQVAYTIASTSMSLILFLQNYKKDLVIGL